MWASFNEWKTVEHRYTMSRKNVNCKLYLVDFNEKNIHSLYCFSSKCIKTLIQEHGEKKQNEPKKLVESTVTDKKQKFAENITVVEPIQEKPYSQVGTVVGIDALKDAVYSEKELVEQRKMPDKMAPGLDCLRYAEWTDELNKSIDDVLDFGVGQTVLNKYTHKFYGGNYVEVDYSKCESKQSKEDIQDDWETVLPKTKSKSTVVKQMEKTTKQKEVTDADQTPPVTKLQSALLKAFPNCNDLNVKSEAGFQAHLTLGQCDTQNVNTFIEDIKRNWRDICFTVSSIYVISRRKADPFEIRHEVKFEV